MIGQSLKQLPRMPEGLQPAARMARKIVSFDYVVTLPLIGERDNTVHNVINISVEGQFVATAISYSLLVNERETPIDFFGPEKPESPAVIKRPGMPGAILELEGVVGKSNADSRTGRIRIFGTPRSRVQVIRLLRGDEDVLNPPILEIPEDGQILDPDPLFEGPAAAFEGTIIVRDWDHNLSSSEIHVQVDVANKVQFTPQFGPRMPCAGVTEFDVLATPDIQVLVYHWKASEPVRKQLKKAEIIDPDNPDGRLEPGRLVVRLPKDKPLVAGDKVVLRAGRSNLVAVAQVPDNVLDFSFAAIPACFLKSGLRVNPKVFNRLANGSTIPDDELKEAFRPCGVMPEELSFLYTIIDNGSGRELQSEPIHNIAGLGIANGDRPFRVFPKPIVFEPRSVIQFLVKEISGGPGILYFVLQGYKVLGTGGFRSEG